MFQLIEFSVSNFRSIRERISLSMLASNKLVSRAASIDEGSTIPLSRGEKLLTSAAIYGANASGKSNVLAAVRFMRHMVLNSSKETSAAQKIPIEPFRLGENTNKAASFEMVFLSNRLTYRYGFEVDADAVRAEWLFSQGSGKERQLFIRDEKGITPSGANFKEGKGLEGRTRANALFLSVVAQFNGPIALGIQQWFSERLKVISGLDDAGYKAFTVHQCEDAKWRSSILSFVKAMDVGIEDLSISKVPLIDTIPTDFPAELRKVLVGTGESEISRIGTVHRRFNAEGEEIGRESFDIEQHESEGTKKIFALAGPILDTLNNGRVLVVDELDARLHPLITAAIIRLFNTAESNTNKAQLVFTTHDVNILQSDLLRRDQVWFAEKDRVGATTISSLLEYKPRNDTSLAKNYVQGRYGAIPLVGDLVDLVAGDQVHAP